MAKDQAIFSTIYECNTKQIFVGDDRFLIVVGSETVPIENGHFSDVLCIPKISCTLLSVYQIAHWGEGKTVTFTPHQVVIKDFKNTQNVLATGTVDDITPLYKFNHYHFFQVFTHALLFHFNAFFVKFHGELNFLGQTKKGAAAHVENDGFSAYRDGYM